MKTVNPNVLTAAQETAEPTAIVEAALLNHATDKGAMLEPHVIHALKMIRAKSAADYQRLVSRADGLKTQLDNMTSPPSESRDDSQTGLLVSLAKKQCSIIGHDENGLGVVVVQLENCKQVHYTNASEFAEFLRGAAYKSSKVTVSDSALNNAIATINSIGKFDGPELKVNLRVCKHGGDYYIGLCNNEWSVIRLNADGYKVVKDSPVYFTRNKNMRALPTPVEREANLDLLWVHVNVPEFSRLLVLAWILDAFRPETPYPGLEISGTQGSAKSTTHKRIRELIDPNKVALRSSPKSVEDIFVAAANNHCVSFENLSNLTSQQQDALCTLATGGGFGTRQFYSNADEHVLETKRPFILNGINPVASQADLIDRMVHIEAPVIETSQRQTDGDLDQKWEGDISKIFSGLLDLFVRTLQKLPEVKLTERRRMADFHSLGEAVALALGHKPGVFTEQYLSCLKDGAQRGLDVYGIASGIQILLYDQTEWQGTYKALLASLLISRCDQSHWPKSPRGLSAQIRRIQPSLKEIGIEVVQLPHSRDGAMISLRKL